jgi:cytochrome c oxidase cbb3-type subunit IV
MDTYSLLREIADSWVLIGLFGFFLSAVVWAFRPGSRDTHKDAAQVPFRHEDAPAPDMSPRLTDAKVRS